AKLFDDGGVDSLSYSLTPQTTYFFKLGICDTSGRCTASKCSNFTTSSPGRCPYCNFVTRIKTPSGWYVGYDADLNGTYEHIQGRVCGENAGMKTNYTIGRSVNIKLSKNDNTTYIVFLNATLTKTALNDKVRTISGSQALESGQVNGIGYTGMPKETRDKIINNLHPEVCQIKISSTSCTYLWHCDDNGENCVDRTSESTLIEDGGDYCLWQLPYCEFSLWAAGNLDAGSVDNAGKYKGRIPLYIEVASNADVGSPLKVIVRKDNLKGTGPLIFNSIVRVLLGDVEVLYTTTDKDGAVYFTPKIPGDYIVETFKTGYRYTSSIVSVLGEDKTSTPSASSTAVETTLTVPSERTSSTVVQPVTTQKVEVTTTVLKPLTTSNVQTTISVSKVTTSTISVLKESDILPSKQEPVSAVAGLAVALVFVVALVVVAALLVFKRHRKR
ncbi:MAG: hypothetical protein KKD39_03550, partial [Candidatus Altiarchaeota archaeon]|nr:hypothetical protein [Candidatus Altiarchaeota archaeon]